MSDLRWARGGEADLVAFDGDRISVRSSIPSAPGSRPDATMASGSGLRIKVHRCQKVDASFLIEGRLIDLRRSVRDELALLLAAHDPGAKTSGT
jgi:hypothetical protein